MRPHTKWSFCSTFDEFDGERILREAKAARLELFEISRGENVYTYCTDAFLLRCRRVNLSPSVINVDPIPYIDRGFLRVKRSDVGQHYRHCVNGRAHELLDELMRREAERVRTTVRGWRAEDL